MSIMVFDRHVHAILLKTDAGYILKVSVISIIVSLNLNSGGCESNVDTDCVPR